MANPQNSEKLSYPSKYVNVLNSQIHYIEDGVGDPILLLHGVPTSSYIWRNIIPHLAPLGRCIAPDLIGFGRSGKPDIEYSIFDHIKYIEEFIKVMGLKRITVIMHGWGSVIGLDYAMRHESNCKGLVFYEAFLRAADSQDISLPFQEQLMSLGVEEEMPEMMIDGVSFIDKILPQNAMRTLSEVEMQNYREPFLQGNAKPIVQYLRDLPRGNGEGKVEQLIVNYSKKLIQSKLPKLFLYTIPGFVTTIATVMWAKENLPNLEVADLGEELHLAQESNPELLGETISVWLQSVEQTK
ncbi:MAG: haloalkane dehalogenase [Gammaproteobacteria bacterium]|nr:haloalkane dehalogenase [Gammaproteobacteria bacterium]